MSDRTYWRVSGAWHALVPHPFVVRGECGRTTRVVSDRIRFADRIPPDGHLCQNCGRIIAAATDIEGVPV